MKLSRDQPFLDDRVHHRVEQRDVGVGLELQVVRRVPRELGAPRVGEDQLRPVLHRVLDPRRRHRMIDDGIGADQEHDVRLQHVHHRIGDGARADAFEQRRDARRVAKPRAMVDVVGAEARAHELLEEIRFLVRALRRAESRQRAAAARVADLRERAAGQFQRLVPASLRGTPRADSRDPSRSRPTSACRACGSAASSAAADGARSRSRSGPSRTAARGSRGRRGPRRGRSCCRFT